MGGGYNMAHFYGTLQGNRGRATRMGTRKSGLSTVAASWQGSVRVDLYETEDGTDCARVHLAPWHGRGMSRVLYDGPVSGIVPEAVPGAPVLDFKILEDPELEDKCRYCKGTGFLADGSHCRDLNEEDPRRSMTFEEYEADLKNRDRVSDTR